MSRPVLKNQPHGYPANELEHLHLLFLGVKVVGNYKELRHGSFSVNPYVEKHEVSEFLRSLSRCFGTEVHHPPNDETAFDRHFIVLSFQTFIARQSMKDWIVNLLLSGSPAVLECLAVLSFLSLFGQNEWLGLPLQLFSKTDANRLFPDEEDWKTWDCPCT